MSSGLVYLDTYLATEDSALNSDFAEKYPRSLYAPGKPQAVPLPGSEKPGHSAVYRNSLHPEALVTSPHPRVRTVHDIFSVAAAEHKNEKGLGRRIFNGEKWSEYQWQTWEQVGRRRTNFGSGLRYINDTIVQNGKSNRYGVGLFAPNQPEWVITDAALAAYNLYNVTLYDTLGAESSAYILNLCDINILVLAVPHIPQIIKLKDKLPNLKVLISTDPLHSSTDIPGQSKEDLLRPWVESVGMHLFEFQEVEQLGEQNPIPHDLPLPSDIHTINFTSGTTGNPKGVVLTHSSAISTLAGSLSHMPSHLGVDMYYLSYLPLAHIYERVTLLLQVILGSHIGFMHGAVTELMDDIKSLRPSNMIGVPRVYNRIEAALYASAVEAPGLKGALSRRAIAGKLDYLHKYNQTTHPLWDRLWANKVRKIIGLDRCEHYISGAAPISDMTLDFLRVVFSTAFVQGYGLTESFAASCLGLAGDNEAGHSGPPTPSLEIRVRDVPQMGYTAKDKPWPRGELMLRGPNIFREYYKEPEKTMESFDDEGWFATGDIAAIDNLGRVRIVDRVKNFFKLAQGEYISPEKIENALTPTSPFLSSILVYGNSHETFLVGILSIEPQGFSHYLETHLGKHIDPSDVHNLNKMGQDLQVRKLVLDHLHRAGKSAKLNSMEMIRNCYLYVEPFTIESDTLTPSLKIRRPQAAALYEKEIAKLYKEGMLIKSSGGNGKKSKL